MIKSGGVIGQLLLDAILLRQLSALALSSTHISDHPSLKHH